MPHGHFLEWAQGEGYVCVSLCWLKTVAFLLCSSAQGQKVPPSGMPVEKGHSSTSGTTRHGLAWSAPCHADPHQSGKPMCWVCARAALHLQP